MIGRMRFGLVAAAGFALLLASTPVQADPPNGAQAFKCTGGLAKGAKIANFVEKFVTKCTTDYNKRNLFLIGEKAKGPEAINKSGELCTSFVGDKALGVVDTSPIDTGPCGDTSPDDDLRALGFPDLWTPAIVSDLSTIDGLRAGLERAAANAPNVWAIMEAVGTGPNSEITDPNSDCQECEDLRNAFIPNGAGPCQQYVCGFDAASNITVSTSALNVGVATTGAQTWTLCEYPGVTTGDIFVYAGPSRAIKASLTGLADVCVVSTGTKGYITGAGGRVVGDWETCQDHIVGNGTCSTTTTTPCEQDSDCPASETCAGNTAVDGCVVTGLNGSPFAENQCANEGVEGNCSTTTTTVCQTDSDCPMTETCVETLVTGGACFRSANTHAGAAGDASIATALINTIVLDAGPDTVPCTADDNADPAAPVPLVLTTEAAEGIIYSNNRGVGTHNPAPISGASFALTGADSIESGYLDGTLVSVFPTLSLDVSALVPGTFLDGIISATLICENPEG